MPALSNKDLRRGERKFAVAEAGRLLHPRDLSLKAGVCRIVAVAIHNLFVQCEIHSLIRHLHRHDLLLLKGTRNRLVSGL